jgi:DNA-binding MarR family transcriptional regulator
MREYKDIISRNADLSNPANRSFKQVKVPASNIEIDESRNIDPAITAAFLLKSRAVALEQLRDSKLHIDDISWHILLDLIVSMDTKKPVTALDLAITLNVTDAIMLRYVNYMIDAGLVDKHTDADDVAQVPLKLTAAGNALSRDILQKIGQELVNF